MRLIDISRGLSPATAVWPGDQPFDWSWTAQLEEGDAVNLGAITLSTHTGTHVDAPLHVQSEGASTNAFDPETFVGPAEVIDVTGAETITPSHVRSVGADRVLFKTAASALAKDEWPHRITPLAPETVPLLAEQGVELIGTDAPSVDPLDSTDLPTHHALIDAGIVNIEGLTLTDVQPGRYSLLALPLKLEEADAAPVRALLGERSLFG